MTVVDATLRESLASSGGAIYKDLGGVATLTRCQIGPDNHAVGGGGLYNLGVMVLDRTTIGPGNSSSAAGGGGGIANFYYAGLYSGVLTLTNSTVEGNSANQGGGIYNGSGGVLRLDASTLASNSAENGGGLYNNGTAKISSSTIAQNTARSQGGGIFALGGTGNDLYIVQIQRNGSIVLGGNYLDTMVSENLFGALRLTRNGSEDHGFGSAGFFFDFLRVRRPPEPCVPRRIDGARSEGQHPARRLRARSGSNPEQLLRGPARSQRRHDFSGRFRPMSVATHRKHLVAELLQASSRRKARSRSSATG